MRSTPKDDHRHHQLRQVDMPLISIPTETVRTHEARQGNQPPSVTSVSVPNTSNFVFASDTCGFTTAGAVTCELGYECTNVGDFRGCCLLNADDCISTIYTACVGYSQAVSAQCGDHTLCCPEKVPHCFTYVYTTDNEPGATLRLVECNPSEGFGELFPYPPELTMVPEGSGTDSSSNSSESTDNNSSHSSVSTGAIAGAAIGGVVGVIIIAVVAGLLFRSRRKRRRTAAIRTTIGPPIPPNTMDSSPESSPTAEKDHARARAVAAGSIGAGAGAGGSAKKLNRKSARKSLLRPLSLIREQPSPIPTGRSSTASQPAHEREKSHSGGAAGTSTRQSYGPNWPLGSNNPLAAHPVDENLKKRLSDGRLGLMGLAGLDNTSSGQRQQPRVPSLQIAPRPPGSKPARSLSSTSASTRAGLRSPRQNWMPVSPIEGRINRPIDKPSADDAVPTGSTSSTRAVDPEPVSPIESEDDNEKELQRFSYVSAPSAIDELVSPVSGNEIRGDIEEGEGNSGTVSPLESRRGSMES